uniref:Uncharacterized protein n=1 Tax=Romanomermis culicivorax TaxID=13658 RepID=A0A915IGI1_ROMCU
MIAAAAEVSANAGFTRNLKIHCGRLEMIKNMIIKQKYNLILRKTTNGKLQPKYVPSTASRSVPSKRQAKVPKYMHNFNEQTISQTSEFLHISWNLGYRSSTEAMYSIICRSIQKIDLLRYFPDKLLFFRPSISRQALAEELYTHLLKVFDLIRNMDEG